MRILQLLEFVSRQLRVNISSLIEIPLMNLNTYSEQIAAFTALIQANLPLTLALVGILWVVFFLNKLLHNRLNRLGIYPRHLSGLIGIPCYTFLHGDFGHLFFNSIPLLVLVNFLLIEGLPLFIVVSIIIILIAGLGIWLIGRPAIHIGASSLITGYWGYLVINAYKHPSVISILLGIICLYYFIGIFLSIFPSKEKVSWEGHLCGLLAGFAASYLVVTPYVVLLTKPNALF